MSLQITASQPLKVFTTVRAGSGAVPSLAHLEALSRKRNVQGFLYCGLYDPHLTSWRSGTGASKEDIKQKLLEHEEKNLTRLRHEHCAMCTCSSHKAEWRHPVADGIIENARAFNADLVLLPASHLTPGLDYKDWDILTQSTVPVLVCNTTGFQPYRKILVAVDPAHAHGKAEQTDQRLLTEADLMAEMFEAELHVVHAYPSVRTYVTPELLVPQEMMDTWAQEAEQAVIDLVGDYDIAGIHMAADHPRKVILDTAKSIGADLIVMGVTSRSLIPDLIVGHTAEYVINHSTVDVMAVNPAKEAA